jgi:hypothetical protein
MRFLRCVCRLALPVGLLIGGINAASAEVSQEVQQACTPDAMRLCSEFIPDRAKITACMMRKRRELSEACLSAMHGGRKVYRRERPVYHHYYHHYHHEYRHHYHHEYHHHYYHKR